MDDVLILEDGSREIEILTKDKLEGLTFNVVKNSWEFRKYIDGGNEARLYFLDDRVPDKPNAAIEPAFIKNCSYLFGKNPNAKVFYTGYTPDREQQDFCKKHNIGLVNKLFDLWKVANRELSKY